MSALQVLEKQRVAVSKNQELRPLSLKPDQPGSVPATRMQQATKTGSDGNRIARVMGVTGVVLVQV
jgi:hypothetical protein